MLTVIALRYRLNGMKEENQAQAYIDQGMSIAETAILTGLEEEEIEDFIRPVTPSPFANKGIPIEKILGLARRGFKDGEIAKLLDCSKSNVYDRLEVYREDLKNLDDYKEFKADIFNMKQRELLNALTSSKIKKMSALAMVTAIGILNDKIRAETGKDMKVALNLSKVIHEIHSTPGGVNLPQIVDIERLTSPNEPGVAESDSLEPEDRGGAPGG